MPAGDHMAAIPSGRAYRHGDKLYADSIHCVPFAEKLGISSSKVAPLGPIDFYLGIGGPINMAHIAILRPRYAIFADINPFQSIYGRVMFSGIGRNRDPGNFVIFSHYCEQYILQHIRRDRATSSFCAKDSLTSHLYGTKGTDFAARLFRENKPPGAFFKTPSSVSSTVINSSNYAYLRHMALAGRIGFLTLDVLDPASLSQLKFFIKSHIPVGSRAKAAIYVSSLYSFYNGYTDWSGIKRETIDEQSLLQNFGELYTPEHCTMMDHKGVFSLNEFIGKIKDKKSCNKKRESEAEFGAVKLAPLFI